MKFEPTYLLCKFRLAKSGAGQVIYLLEEYNLEDTSDRWSKAIETAKSSTQVVDGFFLKQTKSLDQTISYLVAMTGMLKSLHEVHSPTLFRLLTYTVCFHTDAHDLTV
jgi:crossover junction endonuclease MUS81